jgi:hypothetical protein
LKKRISRKTQDVFFERLPDGFQPRPLRSRSSARG